MKLLVVFNKKSKLIAFCFFCIFYAELAWPLFANASVIFERPIIQSGNTNSAISLENMENTSQVNPLRVLMSSNINSTFSTKSEKFFEEKPVSGQIELAGTEQGPGPTQPEMQSFKGIGADNMVDLFSGDFSYNIPLMDVGGYPIGVHYQSGVTMDQEASWVGLGWNINPGTITRNMRGLPDDFNGTDSVEKTISIKPNTTYGLTLTKGNELLGSPLTVSTSKSIGVYYNNYKGWGTEVGINPSINASIPSKGVFTVGLSLGLGINSNSQEGLNLSPGFATKLATKGNIGVGLDASISTNYNSRTGIQALQMNLQTGMQLRSKYVGVVASIPSTISFAKPSYMPSINIPYTSAQKSFSLKIGKSEMGFYKSKDFRGYGSIQKISDEDKVIKLAAYGYLFYQRANTNEKGLLDFNRDKDVPYRDNISHIAVPTYTYDTYSISGEGTGGMFRPYRGDIGFVRDAYIATKSGSDKFAFEYGAGGGDFHIGIDHAGTYSTTISSQWKSNNTFKSYVSFRDADSTFEAVYFKNPGEKTSVRKAYYNAIGNEDLVKANLLTLDPKFPVPAILSNKLDRYQKAKVVGTMSFNNSYLSQSRDKRTQVITYLNAIEASKAGLDTIIRSYNINTYPFIGCNNNYESIKRVDGSIHKASHISEIDVLQEDGRKYIYGIPAYNIEQKDVTFSTLTGSNETGLVSYDTTTDNSTKNNKGEDNYFSSEKMPAYTHSFLLSGILSADYVDIKGDGITDDDNGDAIKFNYTRLYSQSNAYKWRAPYGRAEASYSEGLKTDTRDEKGSYCYGQKELWYLNSVESKTMIATFVLNTDSERKDVFGVLNENGGANTGQKLYSLKEINLYSKADIAKNGISNAKPIKTVHFEYDYSLCQGAPSSQSGYGKLTLKKIWFSYNKNSKQKLNPYTFSYNSNNPTYNNKSYDRWGNYKDPSLNPGALSNIDHPYTLQGINIQDSITASQNVAAWALDSIGLPSGAKMKITYESDDYAFVENRRAMQFFQIAGFGSSSSATPNTSLYSISGPMEVVENDYLFIKVSDQVTSSQEILQKYLEGIKKLYFKIRVQMPSDQYGSGTEMVPVHANILDYGVKGSPSDKMIWIRVAPIAGSTPMLIAATQYLRLNLPSKAFKYSDPGTNASLIKILVSAILSVFDNINKASNSFFDYSTGKGWCNYVDTSKSFTRLNVPNYRKFGGGHRVKKVVIYDNWNKMTGQAESKYGQEFTYTVEKEINGVKKSISSGVAAYEPMIGKDENPFFEAIDFYKEEIGALAPTNYYFTEAPLMESYYPGAMVGYSKVRVQTIHKDKKSANGYEETEFYTTYDFPVKEEYTSLADGKMTYDPKLSQFFRFDAKHYVTLSQGFKVELNDMNGKLKRTASYAQNDLRNPISTTINYYKMDNENLQSLSSIVNVVDSSNGTVNTAGQIGEDIEMIVDLREQQTNVVAPSTGINLDVLGVLPFPIFSFIPQSTFETNRYRAAAIVKVVNRYGILDSIIHVEKGSKVSTKNMIYDGETGDVLLSRTNNEFDDPVYSFNYPAHWAYSGIGSAYKNINAVVKNVAIFNGKLYLTKYEKFFESGDEILIKGKILRKTSPTKTVDTCFLIAQDKYYDTSYMKIWAMEANKGKEGKKGIYFIDKNGDPITILGADMKIIRSGKRNILNASVGSIMCLESPLKQVSGQWKIVIDSAAKVINASAGRFKDFWKVDSLLYKKDTTIMSQAPGRLQTVSLNPDKSYRIVRLNDGDHRYIFSGASNSTSSNFLFTAKSNVTSTSDAISDAKSWINFPLSAIPSNAIITSANLMLYQVPNFQHYYFEKSNESYLRRMRGPWFPNTLSQEYIESMFYENNNSTDPATQSIIPPTTIGVYESRNDTSNVTAMVQAMHSDYYNSGKIDATAIMIGIVDTVATEGECSLMYISGLNATKICSVNPTCNFPTLNITYYLPCTDSSSVQYTAHSGGGDSAYYCNGVLKDTTICRPNIDSLGINPYVWGVLGNWRMDRAYTYYDRRKESDPAVATNIRKDGEIKSFMPYWSFTSTGLQTVADTNRWVWNSEMNLFNRRGYEVENSDPLGRYNSGQYGYSQTLPVAVAQNSKYRNKAFEGFEDYDYKTDTCNASLLCSNTRFINFLLGGGTRDTIYRHSGKYSLKITSSNNTNVFPLTTVLRDTASATLSIPVDSTQVTTKEINGLGQGLLGQYNSSVRTMTHVGSLIYAIAQCNPSNSPRLNYWRVDSTINFDWRDTVPSFWNSNPNCKTKYNMEWTGMIQPRYSDYYNFYADYNDGLNFEIRHNGAVIARHEDYFGVGDHSEKILPNEQYPSIFLEAGKLYDIKINYRDIDYVSYVNLYWESNFQQKEIIPKKQLYTPAQVSALGVSSIESSTATNKQIWCVKPTKPKAKNSTVPGFSPIVGGTFVVSGWVKENQICQNGNYQNARIDISFAGNAATYQLKPAGNIIEGWQRIEDTVFIPSNATSMNVNLRGLNDSTVYYDDLRIHPFNSNMKSYVYNPVDIRLMAELDENNYATFYEYDDEGTLIRIKKETERGIMTIQETRSALLKK